MLPQQNPFRCAVRTAPQGDRDMSRRIAATAVALFVLTSLFAFGTAGADSLRQQAL